MTRKPRESDPVQIEESELDAASGGLLPYIEQDNLTARSRPTAGVQIETITIAHEKIVR